MRETRNKWLQSNFYKWVVNNKSVTFLVILLLILVNILLFTKVDFLLQPLVSFIKISLLPIILTGLLYYLLNPIVDWLERHKVSRTWGISIVFILIVLLIVWGLGVAIPSIQRQVVSFSRNLPIYTQYIEDQVTALLEDDRFAQFRPEVQNVMDSISEQAIDFAQRFSSNAVDWASGFISKASQVVVAVLIMPFILFYLLRDGQSLRGYVTNFLPTSWRNPVGMVLADMNHQLSNYVRGQVTVAMIVALLFSILFSIIGLNYAVTLGVLAGFLNLIPYLGSFLAMIPAVILGIVEGPFMLLKVLIVFMVEQTIEGRFVTPLIIGSSLRIHPITILFILLTAGQLYGVWGVFLGIPIYATIKVVVTAIFEWYKAHSSLYTDHLIGESETIDEQ